MPKKKLDHGNLAARTAIASPRRGAKRLERVRKAEAAYTEAAKDYQDGVRLMAHGLRDMLKTSQGLLHIPASTQVVSQRAILTRASQWLAAQLFEKIAAEGMESLSGSEKRLLRRATKKKQESGRA